MRVLIFSLNSLFGECLGCGLSDEPGIDFAQPCSASGEVVAMAEANTVSSILLDLGEPESAGLVRVLRTALPEVCILALAVNDQSASDVLDCARLGCHGIIPRDASLENVARIIRRAERGEVAIRPEITGRLMRALAEVPPAKAAPNLTGCLTRREREICSLAAEGLTNKEIAREVNRSEGTVKNHVRSILAKLELPRRGAIGAYLAQAHPAGSDVSSEPAEVVGARGGRA